MKLPLLLLAAAVALPSWAGDAGFDGLVRGIERECGIHRTRIPLMGLVTFFTNVARPAGTSGLKLAVFENFAPPRETALDDLVARQAGPEWRPFVRVVSRHETTCIRVRTAGKGLEMLIATMEPGEATVVRLKISQSALKRWLKDPEGMAGSRH